MQDNIDSELAAKQIHAALSLFDLTDQHHHHFSTLTPAAIPHSPALGFEFCLRIEHYGAQDHRCRVSDPLDPGPKTQPRCLIKAHPKSSEGGCKGERVEENACNADSRLAFSPKLQTSSRRPLSNATTYLLPSRDIHSPLDCVSSPRSSVSISVLGFTRHRRVTRWTTSLKEVSRCSTRTSSLRLTVVCWRDTERYPQLPQWRTELRSSCICTTSSLHDRH